MNWYKERKIYDNFGRNNWWESIFVIVLRNGLSCMALFSLLNSFKRTDYHYRIIFSQGFASQRPASWVYSLWVRGFWIVRNAEVTRLTVAAPSHTAAFTEQNPLKRVSFNWSCCWNVRVTRQDGDKVSECLDWLQLKIFPIRYTLSLALDKLLPDIRPLSLSLLSQ